MAHAQSFDVLGRAIHTPEKRYVVPLFARQNNGTATNGTAPALELPNQGDQDNQQGQDQEGERREQEENQRQQEAARRQREEEQRQQQEAARQQQEQAAQQAEQQAKQRKLIGLNQLMKFC